jgi:hypothetical protein
MKLKKRLTKRMEETLMDCHEREILGHEPCDTYNVRSTKGLYERGLLAARSYAGDNGKPKTVFYVTELGKHVLKSLTEKGI